MQNYKRFEDKDTEEIAYNRLERGETRINLWINPQKRIYLENKAVIMGLAPEVSRRLIWELVDRGCKSLDNQSNDVDFVKEFMIRRGITPDDLK